MALAPQLVMLLPRRCWRRSNRFPDFGSVAEFPARFSPTTPDPPADRYRILCADLPLPLRLRDPEATWQVCLAANGERQNYCEDSIVRSRCRAQKQPRRASRLEGFVFPPGQGSLL